MWAIRVFEWAADSSSFLQNRHTRCCYTAEVSSRPSRENNASQFSLRRCHKTVAIQPCHGMKSNCRHSFVSFLLFSFLSCFCGLSDQLSNSYLCDWIDCSFKPEGKSLFSKNVSTTAGLLNNWNITRSVPGGNENWDTGRHKRTMLSFVFRKCIHKANWRYNAT